MATQAERRRATRHRLLEAARSLFRAQGVAETTTQAVLDEAQVSRGALYHHFASRDDLVAAVYEDESAAAIARAVARTPTGASPLEALLSSCLAWLDEVGRPEIARILVIDGPAALGWARCREIEARHSLGRMRAGLEAATRAGEIEVVSPELVARMLNAVLSEAALSIAGASRRRRARAREDAEVSLRQLMSGLRPGGKKQRR